MRPFSKPTAFYRRIDLPFVARNFESELFRQGVDRCEVELAELHLGAFRLNGDLALLGGALGAVVHEVAV